MPIKFYGYYRVASSEISQYVCIFSLHWDILEIYRESPTPRNCIQISGFYADFDFAMDFTKISLDFSLIIAHIIIELKSI